jgi:hypothetical protein
MAAGVDQSQPLRLLEPQAVLGIDWLAVFLVGSRPLHVIMPMRLLMLSSQRHPLPIFPIQLSSMLLPWPVVLEQSICQLLVLLHQPLG